uniref:Uncharacterized protein n=1 Tax=Arundo donax TaxID=35708 RepID=A0A0A9FC75_ARUDO
MLSDSALGILLLSTVSKVCMVIGRETMHITYRLILNTRSGQRTTKNKKTPNI